MRGNTASLEFAAPPRVHRVVLLVSRGLEVDGDAIERRGGIEPAKVDARGDARIDGAGKSCGGTGIDFLKDATGRLLSKSESC